MSEISYQNKDIVFKVLSQFFKDKSLSAFGLDLPKIKEVLPNELPTVQVNEKRADNLFLLEDDSLLLLEYESARNPNNLWKYGHYAFRILEKYGAERPSTIRIVIIYTGDVSVAINTLDLGSVVIEVESVFLSRFDAKEILLTLNNKIERGETLTEEDLIRLIWLPLSAQREKVAVTESAFQTAKRIPDRKLQTFVVAGIIAATDKFINEEFKQHMKEWINMYGVSQLFENEKQEELKKQRMEIARTLMEKGMALMDIQEAAKLTDDELKALIIEVEKEKQENK